MGEEHQHDQQNSRGIFLGELHRSGIFNTLRVDISTTRHLGHRRRVSGSGENDSGNLFSSSFLQESKTLSTIVGSLSKIPVKESGLGLLNPVTSAQEKYLSSNRGSVELVQAVTGGGAFSNANNLRTLSEERRDVKKDRDAVYKTNLKGLLRDLKGTYKGLIILSKCTCAWLSVHGTTVSGTVLSATEYRDFFCARYNFSPLTLQSHCDRCVTLSFSIGGLVTTRQNKIHDELL